MPAAKIEPQPEARSGAAPARLTGRDALWASLAVAGFVAWWFLRALPLVGTEVAPWVGGDILGQYVPDYTYLAEGLRSGHLPFWYRWQGQPFLAAMFPGTLYPARLLLLVLDVPIAMHVSTLGHLLLALVATFALCRAIGASAAGALVGAAAFTGAYAVPALYWPPFLEGGAWLPVAGLALVRLAQTGAWRWAVLMGLATGLMVLAGCYQHVLYGVYGLAVLAVALLVDPARRGFLAASRTPPLLLLAAILALATAAPQLLPSLAWSHETMRTTAALTDAQLDKFPFPLAVLRAMFTWPHGHAASYLSIPVALLTLLGCMSARRFGVVLLVALGIFGVLSLGRGTPVFELYRLLPGFAAFRGPERLAFLVAFLAAMGSALGVTALRFDGVAGRLVPALAVAVTFWALFAPVRLPSPLPWTVPASTLAGPPRLMTLVERYTGSGRTLLPGEAGADDIAVKHGAMHHVLGLQDYSPLSSRRLAAYLDAVVGRPARRPDAPELFLGWVPIDRPVVHPELLDMAAVTTLLVKSFVTLPPREPPFRPLARFGRWTLYQNPGALPRAFVVDRARFVATDAEALAVVTSPGFDGRREAVLVGAMQADDPPLAPSSDVEEFPARVTDDTPEHVQVALQTKRPAVLVLTDPFAPGWMAMVDGRPARLRLANALGRGVIVPAGVQRVDFTYRAPGFAWGALLASVTWGAVLAVALGRIVVRHRS